MRMPPETTTKKSISLPAAILSAAVIIAIALIIVFSPKTAQNAQPAAQNPDEVTSVPKDVAVIRADDRVRGDASTAQVAVIEYSDSDCPFCAKFHPTLQQVYKDYGGKVAWVYRYFPLTSLHPNAATEAVALECVAELGGNDAFNNYLDQIINITLTPDPKANEQLASIASSLGVDKALFTKCMAGTTASDRVKKDTDEATKIGAQGTPFSIIVNLKTGEQKIVPGAYPIEDVKGYINDLLK